MVDVSEAGECGRPPANGVGGRRKNSEVGGGGAQNRGRFWRGIRMRGPWRTQSLAYPVLKLAVRRGQALGAARRPAAGDRAVGTRSRVGLPDIGADRLQILQVLVNQCSASSRERMTIRREWRIIRGMRPPAGRYASST